jgi:outer membrane protein
MAPSRGALSRIRKPFNKVSMRVVRWIAQAALMAGLATVMPAQNDWTLADAVAQALDAAPEARMAAARVLAAEAAIGTADAAGRPQFDLRVAYLHTTSPMQAFGAILNQGTFDDRINFNAPGQIDAFTAGLHARYALYTAGRVAAGRAAARAGSAAAEQEAEAARRRLALEVVRTYFQIRQSHEAVAALESALASYDESLRVGRLRESSGQLLVSERLNLEVQRAQTAEQLLGARHAAELAARRFAFLLGLPAGTVPSLAHDDPTPTRLDVSGNLAPQPRPELLALQQRVVAAERQVQAARAARRPVVGTFASAQADRGWRRDGAGESWTAGVAAEVPVFDGASARARISAAEADATVAREMLRQAELGLALEWEQARLAHQLAQAQLAVTEQIVAQAEESARRSRQRFTAGALLSAELIAVETRLADTRVRRAAAAGQERSSLAALRLAAGQPLFP